MQKRWSTSCLKMDFIILVYQVYFKLFSISHVNIENLSSGYKTILGGILLSLCKKQGATLKCLTREFNDEMI